MKKSKLTYSGWLALAALLVMSLSCSDDSTSPATGDRVIDSFPLKLCNSWEYTLQQSIYVEREDTTFSLSSAGRQSVKITRTENIGGLESFGMQTTHMIDYLFSEGSDTTIEQRYFAPTSDGRVLLKADQAVYNPSGGFIPFANGNNEPVYGTMIEVDGQEKFISLEMLGYLLSDSRGSLFAGQQSGTLLASDGVQNDENSFIYADDYLYLYDELYKGLRWNSVTADDVNEIDISARVDNILGELDGYDGPIAEVTRTNSLIGASALNSEQFTQRFYYKGGIGLVKAEISDPEFLIIIQFPDSTLELGVGTWTFTKSLSSHSVR
jgi:hypothetical protein